jgi:hypothetical protein
MSINNRIAGGGGSAARFFGCEKIPWKEKSNKANFWQLRDANVAQKFLLSLESRL